MAADRSYRRFIAILVCFVLFFSVTPMVALAKQGHNYASPEPDTTFVLAPYPVLSGVVLLFINNETGELTAEVRGGNTDVAGRCYYTWSGGATGTGATVMPTLGESVMCAASASGCTGTITASTAVYRVQVELVGNVSGDSASIKNCYGSFCDEVSIDYSVAQIGTESNSVIFSGGYIEDSGTSPALYRIDPCDALDGVITIMATFTHTGDIPTPPIDNPIEPEAGEVPPRNTPTDENGGEVPPSITPTDEDDSAVPPDIIQIGADWRSDVLPTPVQSDYTYGWMPIVPLMPVMPTPPLALIPVAPPPEPLPAESEIIAKTATVRDADSSRGKRLGTLEKGDKLTIPGFVGNYAAVEWEGDIGYVRARDISVAFGAPMDVTITKDGWTYSRTLEKRQYRLTSLEDGQTLQVTGRFGRWYWVTSEDGVVTWIPAAGVKVEEEWTRRSEE